MKCISVYIVMFVILLSMQSCIRDDRSDCKDSALRLAFRYTLNNQHTDLLESEVTRVTVYVFDAANKYVGTYTESGNNLKNKYVQLLLMYLSIDFVIHFIIRYGMNEAILFGGHWMFAIPILLGWLYTRLPVRMYRILDWVIIGFFVLTATINTMEFMRSFLFA